ncbi:protein NEDD1-like [Pristis pectinata]|uniref:protein NEDD1-like n=1 Tax=Pristis pectinata TaxID=685728 RepID=UPI00223D8A68|nr:protein NEDD1-like [Pristis pectinata]
MWDLKTSKLQKSYEGHKDIVTCLTNDCDDQWILSGSRSGEIVLHSMHTDEAAMKLCCQSQQPLRDLQVSSLQKSLLGSVGNDGTVVLWDLNSLQLQHSFKSVHKAPATALCFSPVIESLIVTVGLDKRISAIDTRCKLILHSIRAESPLTAVELLPDGTTLMIGSSQGKVSLYDFRNMEFPVKSSKAHRSAVRCIKLQTMKGKLQKQAAWPTAWNNRKEEAYSVSVATDVSSKSVTSDPRDSYSLQVSSFTASKPSQYRKVMFLATNSFGEIFSPIRSDVSYTNISTIDEFSWTSACHALSCSPLPESESNIMTLGDHSTLAVRPATETLELFREATCLTAKKFDQAQNLHYCTSAQELIEQETNSRTVAKPLSHTSTLLEEGKEEHTTPLVIVRLLENILKDALEEFRFVNHV